MSTSQAQDPMSLIGSQPITPLSPELTYELIPRYGLSSMRDSVARFDSKTGEKINPLRKSYSGYPPKLGLAGKNKAVKHRPALGFSFSQLATFPEEGWVQQEGINKIQIGKTPVAGGFAGVDGPAQFKSSEGLKNIMTRALTFTPSKLHPVVEADWNATLGHEKPRQPKVKNAQPSKSAASIPPPVARSSAAVSGTPASKPMSPAFSRPQRKTAGQKRAYDDEVGEHDNLYPDGASDGNSTDGDSRASHKKQKRANPAPLPPSSYNPASIHQRH